MGLAHSTPTPPTHPTPKRRRGGVRKKKKAIPKSLRAAVWIQHFSEGARLCPVCQRQSITPFTFECGHIVSEAAGGPTVLANLMPICKSCNGSMNARDLREFRLTHFGPPLLLTAAG